MIVKLQAIVTPGKPGKLTELNIQRIAKQFDVDFTLSKMFYVSDLDSNESRGNHSNTNASELMICLQGSFELKLHDGRYEKNYILNQNDAIFIDQNIWIEYKNFKNCLILVCVSINPVPKDSCYNFDEYVKMKKHFEKNNIGIN